MRSTMRSVATVLCALFLVASAATAQDLSQQIAKLGHDAAVSYVTPLFQGWAADLNSAIYHSADLHDILGFDIGVKVSATRMKDEDKTYLFTMPSQLTVSYPGFGNITLHAGTDYDATVTAPTAVGPSEPAHITIRNQTGAFAVLNGKDLVTLPGGFAPAAIGVPLFIPQVAIGLPLGFEVTARFIPTVKLGDYGKVNYLGFGLRHDIDQYIPFCPVDIAVHFMTQKFTLKDSSNNDVLKGSGTAFGVEVSKKLLILTLYGGFQLESGKFELSDFNATYVDPASQRIVTGTVPGFTIESKNKNRLTVGARLLLLFINAHVEYSIAKSPVIAAGVGITLR